MASSAGTLTSARAHDDAALAVCWLDAHALVTGSVDESLTLWRADDKALKSVKSHAGAHLLGVTALSAETGGHREERRRRASPRRAARPCRAPFACASPLTASSPPPPRHPPPAARARLCLCGLF